MKEYRQNEIIVDRAVAVWQRLLESPTYDNGDSSLTGFVASSMARMIPSNANAAKLAAFGAALKRLLMTPHPEYGYYPTGLCTDYGPEGTLNQAAEESGLKMEFPWKTNSWLHEDCFAISAGYRAASVYHYPMPDGRWLLTTLHGSTEDNAKLVEYAAGGRPEFTIEDPDPGYVQAAEGIAVP